MKEIDSLIEQQIEYYQARALEYDEWFLRQGRYDRGLEHKKKWFDEVDQVRHSLDQFKPTGSVLEIACGTGLWTQQLLRCAQSITALDAVKEVLELNEKRLQSPRVKYIHANIFNWQPEERYDVVFFSFWLSHVPPQYFEEYWKKVRQTLKPKGRVFFVDSKYEQTSTARDHELGEANAGTVKRLLNDGRDYRIVKIFYDCEELEKRLCRLGWDVKINETPSYFLFGSGGVN